MNMKAIFLVSLLVVLQSGNYVTALDDELPDVINNFGFHLYKELAKSNPNLIFSGYSLTTGLNMLLAGARNNTYKELRDLLGYNAAGISTALARALYHVILLKQRGHHARYVLSILNSISVPSDVTLLPAYEGILKYIFYTAEHKNRFGSSNATVNSSVSAATKDNITFFNAANDSSSLVLVSAMIFNGTWKNKFSENLTTDHPFNNGSSIKAIPFMNTRNVFPYYENKERHFKVLELPYAGGAISMILILPNNVTGLPEFEKEANLTTFKSSLRKLRLTRVTVKIPKFASSSNLQLEDVLKGLGMNNSFTPAANFTGIDGQKGHFVSKAVQVAAINVTEGNTVSVSVAETPVTRDPHLLPFIGRATFTADHPFAYIIFHRPTGIILFMGRKTVA